MLGGSGGEGGYVILLAKYHKYVVIIGRRG